MLFFNSFCYAISYDTPLRTCWTRTYDVLIDFLTEKSIMNLRGEFIMFKRILAIVLSIVIISVFTACDNEIQKNTTNIYNEGEIIEVENFENALYDKVKNEILKWDEEDIYAISFFVESNECNEYNGFENVTMWSISYNTEKDCDGADELDEERWNYAFWRQDETMIIDVDTPNIYTDALFEWYAKKGITNIGEENDDDVYDENMNYIGKGPVGHYELLQIATGVAERLQKEGVIKEHFGKELPIIIHGLEYAWYDLEATQKANPDDQADTFLKAMKELGFC